MHIFQHVPQPCSARWWRTFFRGSEKALHVTLGKIHMRARINKWQYWTEMTTTINMERNHTEPHVSPFVSSNSSYIHVAFIAYFCVRYVVNFKTENFFDHRVPSVQHEPN